MARHLDRHLDRRSLLVVAALSGGMFLVLLDVTVVNVALPDIGATTGASLPVLQWVVDAYSVPLAALLLVGGALVDRYGARRSLLTGLGVFGLASLGCAVSGDPAQLVAARALQGVGAAMLLPASQAGVAAAFPDRREQARALGLWAGISSAALPLGPVLGGALVQSWGWQAVFWLNVPVVLLLLLAAATLVLPEGRRAGRVRAVDLPGGLATCVLLGAAVLAVIEAGRGEGGTALAAAVVAGAALVGLLVAEHRSPDPMLPPDLAGRPAFLLANATAAAMNFVGIGSILLLTLLLQTVQGRSSTVSGLALLPLFLPLVALSPMAGRLVARHGPRAPMTAGLLVGATGSLLLLLVGPGSPYPVLLPALVGLGAGMGLLTASVVTAGVQAVPAARTGLAAGVTNAARQAGGALGIAVYGALAGPPTAAARFVAGLHGAALLGAAGWLVAALAVRLPVTEATPHPD